MKEAEKAGDLRKRRGQNETSIQKRNGYSAHSGIYRDTTPLRKTPKKLIHFCQISRKVHINAKKTLCVFHTEGLKGGKAYGLFLVQSIRMNSRTCGSSLSLVR